MAAKVESRKIVIAAFAGNALITIAKLIAAITSGSSAMLAEAVHSAVDTGNQGLLFFGLSRSGEPADAEHPFGYGMELYFWAFVVAIVIFALGAGLSCYEGIDKLLDPRPVSGFLVNYVVLGLALVFEGASWTVAFREFAKIRRRRSLLTEVRRSKDPAAFTGLVEDSAAIVGILTAGVGLVSSQILNREWPDAIGSLVIGAILAVTAFVLARETRSLLTGEAASLSTIREIRRLAMREPSVLAVIDLRTVHFGPASILANIELAFRERTGLIDAEHTIAHLEHHIRARFPDITYIFIEIRSRRRSCDPIRRYRLGSARRN